jgi:3-oxoacyl-[acyl-carrier protein] reductase
MTERVAIVTNVLDYAGPPSAAALAADGFRTVCHSAQFTDTDRRSAYEGGHPNQTAAQARSVEELAAEAMALHGRIDVAISNDAAEVKQGPVQERSAADYRALLEAFTVTPFRLVSAVLPHMRSQGYGRIVLITSGAALRPMPDLVLYSAARSATNTMVKALAAELGPAGLSVNAIAPYLLLSNYFPGGMDNPDFAKRVRELIPMQRPGQPAELGALVSLLASGKADGGQGSRTAPQGTDGIAQKNARTAD